MSVVWNLNFPVIYVVADSGTTLSSMGICWFMKSPQISTQSLIRMFKKSWSKCTFHQSYWNNIFCFTLYPQNCTIQFLNYIIFCLYWAFKHKLMFLTQFYCNLILVSTVERQNIIYLRLFVFSVKGWQCV